MEKGQSNTDKGICVWRLLDAPIALVWQAWTEPRQIAQWWGPDGFTNTIHQMDMHAGGRWNLVMHGPDKKDYDNESIFTEVIVHEKIVYEHISGHRFLTIITFEPREEQTMLNWSMEFEDSGEFMHLLKNFSPDIGLNQNIDRLIKHIKQINN